MPRSVNAVASRARRKRILKSAKGYWGKRKNVLTIAKYTIEKGLQYAYRDRRVRKREFRKLWIQRINAGARELGLNYATLMNKIKTRGILINRKVLAELAFNDSQAFASIVQAVK